MVGPLTTTLTLVGPLTPWYDPEYVDLHSWECSRAAAELEPGSNS